MDNVRVVLLSTTSSEFEVREFTDMYKDTKKFLNDAYLEAIMFAKNGNKLIYCYLDEEGKFNDSVPNLLWRINKGGVLSHQDVLFGNLVFFAVNGEGDEVSLTDEDISFLEKNLISGIDYPVGSHIVTRAFSYNA